MHAPQLIEIKLIHSSYFDDGHDDDDDDDDDDGIDDDNDNHTVLPTRCMSNGIGSLYSGP